MKYAPFVILMIALLASGCAAYQDTARLNNHPPSVMSRSSAQLEAHIQNWAIKNEFNGVIAVAGGSGEYISYVDGLADEQSGRLLTVNSVFQTGFVDKFFASIVVFKLMEDGVLDLHAPISDYLPDYREDTGRQITLHHLLTNRSGLPEHYRPLMGKFIGAWLEDRNVLPETLGLPIDIAGGVAPYASGDLKFTPGSEFDYVNVNWVLVHYILEEVTGKSYETLLKTHLFGPANMDRSGIFSVDLHQAQPPQQDVAIGYDATDTQFTGDYPLPGFLGGGTYTSARDMVSLMDALYSGQLLNTESLMLFSTITTTEENYAFGGRVVSYEGEPDQLYSWQSGSNGATNLVAIHKIGDDYSFVAMSNFADSQDIMFELSREIEGILKSNEGPTSPDVG